MSATLARNKKRFKFGPLIQKQKSTGLVPARPGQSIWVYQSEVTVTMLRKPEGQIRCFNCKLTGTGSGPEPSASWVTQSPFEALWHVREHILAGHRIHEAVVCEMAEKLLKNLAEELTTDG